jgi:diadenylate cyclase
MPEDKKYQEYKTLNEIIPILAPGSELRGGLDEILKGDIGGLIVIGRNLILECIIRGGFRLDVPLTPNSLFELAKMDGAIIVSNDLKQIIYANAHLMPDKDIESKQTGIRHRSAEQTAKQTNLPVIAISKRRKNITLFFKEKQYLLKPLPLVIAGVDQNLRGIFNLRSQIEAAINELTYYEFTNNVSINDVVNIIQKIIGILIQKKLTHNTIRELGSEGIDMQKRLEEYTDGFDRELELIFLDYYLPGKDATVDELIHGLVVHEHIPPKEELIDLLGYNGTDKDEGISPKGYRALSKIPKLSETVIDRLVDTKKNLFNIMITKPEELATETSLQIKTTKLIIDRLNRMNEVVLNRIYNR